MEAYDHRRIEKKWQKRWKKKKLYEFDEKSKKPKYYPLIEFPYPSGDGLHVGHPRPYIGLDIVARKRRMEGYNVLYPIGWDAFGLPTENYAIKTKTPPAVVTKKNTDTFRRQIEMLGISFDWSREINTTDPAYYKWTQWIFLQFWKHGLAYKKKTEINWCLSCKIGLANEEVVDSRCERCAGETEKREKEQWMLAITKYADRLYAELDLVDYLEKIKVQQRNWIGRSEGAEIGFRIKNQELSIRVFTTRPDTLFGATYMVLAPEHKLIEKLKPQIKNFDEVLRYIVVAKKKTEIERTAEGREKTGVRLDGVLAINPANEEEIPVYIADYVLKEYGTGAIMAVPAHDARDFEFAKKHGLPVRQVIAPGLKQTTEPGKYREGEPILTVGGVIAIIKHWAEDKYLALKWKKVAWGTFLTGTVDGEHTPEETLLKEIREETGYLHPKVIRKLGVVDGLYYHVTKRINKLVHGHIFYAELKDGARGELADGEDGNHDIEWFTLDELKSFLTPDTHQYALKTFRDGYAPYAGEGSLVNSGKFTGMQSEEAKKKVAKFAGGTPKVTYKLRDWVFSRQRYWGEPIPLVYCEKDGWVAVPEKDLPVELPEIKAYIPADTGESPLSNVKEWVNTECPKCGGEAKRETDTMPNWAGSSWYYLRYVDPKNDKALADKKKLGRMLPVDWYNGGMEHTTLHLLYSRFWHKFLNDIGAVPGKEPYQKRTSHGLILAENGEKMSKSKGNVINPDDIVRTFGADTLRLYEMFMGPFDQAVSWSDTSIIGPRRFLERIWKLQDKVKEEKTAVPEHLERSLENSVKKVSNDIEKMSFNTAVSQLMILGNAIALHETVPTAAFEKFLRLLAPFAPHLSEELWSGLGHKSSIHEEPWPSYDEAKIREKMMRIAVQVNGKIRGEVEAGSDATEEEVKKLALASPTVVPHIQGKKIKRTIYVKGRLLSVVV